MVSKLLVAWGLMALCVMIHATGSHVSDALGCPSNGHSTKLLARDRLFILLAGWIILCT
jgi:hypothetical protein